MVGKHRSFRIGLIISGSSNWIGGVYYVLNLALAISKYLKKDENAELYVFCSQNLPDEVYQELNAHDINYSCYSSRFIKLLALLRYGRNPRRLVAFFSSKHKLDLIYPLLHYSKKDRIISSKRVYWIPDFQHRFLEEFFSKDELESRNNTHEEIAKHADHLVLSSFDAKSHFGRFHSDSMAKLSVLQFKSIIDFTKIPATSTVISKYSLPNKFFIVCNQFWAHKNHLMVLKALALLKKKGAQCMVVFSGKPFDYRQPKYFDSLQEFVRNNKLEDSVSFVGFIPRLDQLALMKASISVIQPSKFEGWSTVVEDAKTLGKRVLASDLDIHHEQLKDKGVFFDTEDPNALAKLMEEELNQSHQSLNYHLLSDTDYGKKLVSLLGCA